MKLFAHSNFISKYVSIKQVFQFKMCYRSLLKKYLGFQFCNATDQK